MDHDGRMLQVALAASEVEIIAKQFVAGLGRAEDWDPEEFDSVVSVIPAFKFPIFLAVLESKYAVDQDPLTLVEAVRELQDHFLHDVLRKGRLGKQMDYLPLARYYIIILYIICIYKRDNTCVRPVRKFFFVSLSHFTSKITDKKDR